MRHSSGRVGRAASAVLFAAVLSSAASPRGLTSAGAAHGFESQELRCRGGAALRVVTESGRRTPATNEQMMNMTVLFSRGTRPAKFAGDLEPGQCARPDRGVGPEEPAEIRQEIVYFAQEKQSLHGDPVDRSPTAAERHPDSLNVPQYLRNPDHYWTFFVSPVRTAHASFFLATYGRYWKPSKANSRVLGTKPDGGGGPVISTPSGRIGKKPTR